ncbi:alpha-L-glutamate ligase [Deinococcus sp. KSM4-11]|uniref:MvdC/MvdD family ATP grasp protein n=1 Tax=Deinococcus sp. KSM4-11 TaxID=2568654 RepID=UPI0010A50F39|nr:alpha-L-glutamate ligase [Deinococcus sp. KSM4-11]THF87877.1 alpha-L-glutamate ligase [Deinococcus sp. KSM4-11]
MIAVVSYPGEEHTDDVVARLHRAGRDVVRLDLADFPAASGLSCSWEPGAPDAYRVHTAAGEVNLADARAGWWRRVRAHTLDPLVQDPDAVAFALSETNEAVSGMLDALGCPWMNPREADAAAHHKPLQWSVARQVGLTLPRTLVTTRPDDARAFIQDLGVGKVVFKAFIAILEAWRETRLVERQDLDQLDSVRFAPVIFQEYVPGVDLRIIAVGDRLYTAELDAQDTSYPVDMRMVIGEAKVRSAELPRALEDRLLELQRRLGLVYGAIDMRRTPDGEYVFFEVNPAGQWMFVEERTGLPISQAVADHLTVMADTGAPEVVRR